MYIISDEESEEDAVDLIAVNENESQSESQIDSDYFEKPAFVHRKSVSFDLSGDERGRFDHERSHTPEMSSPYYDSEQEVLSKRIPRKGILRASSPSPSNTSTLERKITSEKSLPIIPAVARIKEIETPVHYQRANLSSPSPSTTPARSMRSRSCSPPPSPVAEKVPKAEEIEHENPFRDAFLNSTKTDEYTEMAKVISRSPNMIKSARQQFFSSKSSDNLQEEEVESTVAKENTNMTKSLEKINSSVRPKIKPPPPPKPQNIKKADIVKNLALETFQNTDMGQADFTVYEHDATANTVNEVGSRLTPTTPTANTPSPKLPVRVLTRTISRPRESPPLPPINFATLPRRDERVVTPNREISYTDILLPAPPSLDIKPADAHEENSTDKILLTEEEHRDLMLSENELRKQLQHNTIEDVPQLQQYGSSRQSVNEFSSSNDTLDSWPIMQKKIIHKNKVLSLSTNHINSLVNTNNAIPNNMQPAQQLDALAAAPFLASNIFPSAQILPVHYAHLPRPQTSYSTIPNLSLGSYVLVPKSMLPISNDTMQQQLSQKALQQQQLVSDINKTQRTTATVSPSYTSMQFPSLSEIRTPNAFHFPPLPPTPNDDDTNNYENTLRVSNDTITSSTFSMNSSLNSLPKTSNCVSYYETAEQIYSTIQEDAIYSNTLFFDSRRSSDTSLNRLSLTSSNLPPPLPPKKPGGYMPAKYLSKSQPDLEQKTVSIQTKLKVVGKETTV